MFKSLGWLTGKTKGDKKQHEARAGLSSERLRQMLSTGITTRSGLKVGANDALTYSPVWKAIDLVSGDCGVTPWITYRLKERGKERARDHYCYRLLRRSVSPGHTSNLWKIRTVAQAMLYGNAYSRIYRTGGEVSRLELGQPGLCDAYRTETGGIAYKWRTSQNSAEELLPASEVFHLQGLTFNDLGGLSLVAFARNTIGRFLSAERFSDDYFNNAGMPIGWFTTEQPLSDDAKARFITEFERAFSSDSGRRFGIGVLEEGMGWEQTGVNATDAALIEMLGIGPRDIARFFKIPPHKLAVEGASSYASVEQENLDYYRSCLMHWFSRLECEANEKLIREQEKTDEPGGVFTEFLADAVLRSDSLTRHQIYRIAKASCYMTTNEIRERENLNPIEGGDVCENPFTSTGDMGVDGGGDMPFADEPDEEGQTASSSQYAMAVVVEAVERAAKRLQRSGKTGDELRKAHAEVLRKMLAPAFSLVREDLRLTDKTVDDWLDTLFAAADRGEHLQAVGDISEGMKHEP